MLFGHSSEMSARVHLQRKQQCWEHPLEYGPYSHKSSCRICPVEHPSLPLQSTHPPVKLNKKLGTTHSIYSRIYLVTPTMMEKKIWKIIVYVTKAKGLPLWTGHHKKWRYTDRIHSSCSHLDPSGAASAPGC